MPRKDKNDSRVYRELLSLDYECVWDQYTSNATIASILQHASKSGSGNAGFPDDMYLNDRKKLLILVEVKPQIALHESPARDQPTKYAVDGILWYMKHFLPENIVSQGHIKYLERWKIIGVAVSGDIDDPYNSRITTFFIHDGRIEEQKSAQELLSEQSYINLYENYDEGALVSKVSSSSKKINKWLRSIDSQKRPILLSALMICLYDSQKVANDFRTNYPAWHASTIVDNIAKTVEKILTGEGIPSNKIQVIINELAFVDTDRDLNDDSKNILKDILDELDTTVLPLFQRNSNFDIVGKFYEEFLRFAGVANVKKGIVLTPRHITTLFTKLIDLKYNDVIVDYACGTGSFLISAMRGIMTMIDDSVLPNKTKQKDSVKTKQLIGFEKNATMYTCALSNMMFHGDGKSNLYYCDCFSDEADRVMADLASNGIIPTVGFINPPYGGKDNKDNPTKKEIQFLVKMLDSVSRYGVIIAPLSTYISELTTRTLITQRHTLKYVINMPHDLFMPNAAADTAIAVFETNKPQGDQKVVFTEISDDGFVLSKARGRTDAFGQWSDIENNLLVRLKDPATYADDKTLVYTAIHPGDEWLLQAFRGIDYSGLTSASFDKTIKNRLVYVAKRDLNLVDADLDEISLLEAISDFYDRPFVRSKATPVDVSAWQDFLFGEVFAINTGTRLTRQDMSSGTTNFLGAIQGNNGVREHISEDPLFDGGTITVNYNGSVGEAFYQSEPYWPSDDVYTLTKLDGSRFDINEAMFLVTIIKLHKQNFFYGRKWNSTKMKSSVIKLPATTDNEPDWAYMRDFIAGLSYADLLQ